MRTAYFEMNVELHSGYIFVGRPRDKLSAAELKNMLGEPSKLVKSARIFPHTIGYGYDLGADNRFYGHGVDEEYELQPVFRVDEQQNVTGLVEHRIGVEE